MSYRTETQQGLLGPTTVSGPVQGEFIYTVQVPGGPTLRGVAGSRWQAWRAAAEHELSWSRRQREARA